ncbi:MAG: hypothetical protein ACLQHF_04170 [Terracidiphilus sp.]
MTLTEALHPADTGLASRSVLERQHISLSDAVEQLAGLRLSIVLAARWESSGVLSAHTRAEIRNELCKLRSRYTGKIDEIAMNYGVQAAIAAQEGVEREVSVPKNTAPPRKPKRDGQYEI